MIGVIAYWDYPPAIWGLSKSERIFMNHFRLTMKTFGGTHLIVIDPDSEEPVATDAEISYDCVFSLSEALALVPNNAYIVFVEHSEQASSLKHFSHPEGDTYYVVGSDYSGLKIPAELPQNSDVVEIETPTSIGFYSYIALGIVLTDRYQKEIG